MPYRSDEVNFEGQVVRFRCLRARDSNRRDAMIRHRAAAHEDRDGGLKFGLLRTPFPSPPVHKNPCRSPAEFPPNTRRFAADLPPRLTRSSLLPRSPRAKFNAKTERGPHDPWDTSAIPARTPRGYPDSCPARPTGVPLPQRNSARIPLESPLNYSGHSQLRVDPHA